MRIKPLVISLIALGFVSGSAFAAVDKTVGKIVTNKKTVKLEAVEKKSESVVNTTAAVENANRAQAIVEQNAFNNTTSSINWADRVTVGGFANADLMWGDHEPEGSFAPSGQVVDFYIPNANLLFDAKINDWATAHFNLVYSGEPNVSSTTKVPGSASVDIADGYVTFADFSRTPFYTRLGVQYLPFGDYQRYPLIYTLTQLMEEISQPSLVIGMINDNGLYIQASAFNGPTKEAAEAKYNMRNFNAKLGYYGTLNAFNIQDTKYDVDVAWIRNIYDVDYAANFIDTATSRITGGRSATNRVGGISAHLCVDTGPFDFDANYVTALHSFVQNISSYTTITSYTSNSRLWAADIGAGYSFKTMDYDSRVGLIYQWSGNGQFTADLFTPAKVSFPHYSLIANYNVNIMKNVDLGFAAEHDKSYSYRSEYSAITGVTGTRYANLAMTRLSVKF